MRIVADLMAFALLAGFTTAQMVTSVPGCPAPTYFGICDPYVPGVFINADEKGAISVLSTWHDGPAEKAGVCPGDKIVAVNGTVATGLNWDGLVRELISDSSTPVVLRVQRGPREFDLHVPRIRETTLAALSGEKFVSAISSSISMPSDYYLHTVPEGLTPDSLSALINFRSLLLQHAGFKQIDGMESPAATPEEQLRRLRDATQKPGRIVGVVGLGSGPYSAGFTITVVRQPSEALVGSIVPGSAAHRAGLWVGDELLAVNGHSAENTAVENLRNLLSQSREITLQVRRGGGVHELRMIARPIAELTESAPDRLVPQRPRLSTDHFTGVEAMYDEEGHKAMVAEVSYPSPAFSAAVYPGDVIVSVQNLSLAKLTREQLAEALAPADSRPVSLVLLRSGKRITTRLALVTYGDALRGIDRKLTRFGAAPLHCPD